MSRSIKFRAWDKFQQTYVFSGFHICGEVTCFGGMEQEISNTLLSIAYLILYGFRVRWILASIFHSTGTPS
jgi:hypothetical protein